MKLYTIEIRSMSQETTCDQCGMPLEVGDDTYCDDAQGYGMVYCSRKCGAKANKPSSAAGDETAHFRCLID